MSEIDWNHLAADAEQAFRDGTVITADRPTLERWLVALSMTSPTDGKRRRQGEALSQLLSARLAEPTLQQMADRFRRAFLGAPFGIAVLDRHGNLQECNPAYASLLGRSPLELQRIAVSATIDALDRPAFVARLAELQADGARSFEIEHRLVRDGGQRVWVWQFVCALPEPDGQSGQILSLAIDIAERRRQQESAQRFQLLAEHSRDIVLFMRRDDGRLLEVNAAAVAAYGYTREELLRLRVHDLRAPHTQGVVSEQMGEASRWGLLFETLHRRKNGSVFPVEVSSQGATIGDTRTLISIVRDISRRREAEEALLLSEEKFAKAFATNPAAIVLTRLQDGRIVDVNDTWERLFGYRRHEVVGASSLELAVWPTPADRTRWADELRQRRRFHNREQTLLTRSGETLVMLGSAEILTLAGEEVALSTWLDITDRKRAELALRSSEEMCRGVFEHATTGIAIVEASGQFRRCNPAFCQMLGYGEEELRRMALASLQHAEDAAESARLCADLKAGSARSFETENRLVRKDGRPVWVNQRATLLPDGSPDPALMVLVTDITQRKLAEEELRAARRAAESANDSKDQFLAMLSHELRTPLTPVLATTHLLESDGSLAPEQREALAMIRRNVELEARLIDDLLDLTRVTRNKLELHLERVDVHEQILHVLHGCEPEIAVKRLQVTSDLGAPLHHVRADSARMQQIIWNLAKNAVKFTPDGGQIAVRTSSADDCVHLEVTDNGKGIEAELLPRIFDAFEQGGRGITRRFGGLGLGLAITKALVEAHGGSIAAASAGPGRGSSFTVTLPVCSADAAASPPAAVATHPRLECRILLVEDHVDTLRAMTRLLERLGCEVTPAASATEALELGSQNAFDLLVSDIGLPDGSGHDVMRQLRARHDLKGIALSGYGMEDDVTRAREAGFAAHLCKPVRYAVLEQTIRQLLAAGEKSQAGS